MCNCLCYHLLSLKKKRGIPVLTNCNFLQHNWATYSMHDRQCQDQVGINRGELQSWLLSLKVADLQTVSFIITSCYEQSHSVTVLNGKKWPQTTITSSICVSMAMLAEDVIFFVETVILKIPDTSLIVCSLQTISLARFFLFACYKNGLVFVFFLHVLHKHVHVHVCM